MSEPQEDFTLHLVVLGWDNDMRIYFKIGARGREARAAAKRVVEYAHTMPQTQGKTLTSRLILNLRVPSPPEWVNTPIPLLSET